MLIIVCLAIGFIFVMMPQNLSNYADYEETGNLVSDQDNSFETTPKGPIVSEYEHAVEESESDSEEEGDSSDTDSADDDE